MAHLLHLDSSARSASFSRELTARYAQWWQRHPSAEYTYRDLAAQPVPPIGESWTRICDRILAEGITDIARYRDAVRGPGEAPAWEIVEPLLNELVAADVVLMGVPMYNFSVPAALKAWIDQVTFPRMRLPGKTFIIAGARGGAYSPGAPKAVYDHHERYLRDFFLGHFAVEDVHFINTEMVNALHDPALAHFQSQHRQSRAAALARVDQLSALTWKAHA